jgi:hypothetical protein
MNEWILISYDLFPSYQQRSFSQRVRGDKDDFAKKYRILPTPIKIKPSKVRRT